MIVKNEAHIVATTLQNLVDKVPLTSWVICDTGSTDGTQELIRTFFLERGIPGLCVQHTWTDFATNRTQAIYAAYAYLKKEPKEPKEPKQQEKKKKYLFFFDADDELVGTPELGDIVTTGADKIDFLFGHSFHYVRPLMVSIEHPWYFEGVLHEYLTLPPTYSKSTHTITLKGDYYVISGRAGSRSKDPHKYFKDARVLEKAYHTVLSSNKGLACRYAFYCAQSYKDAIGEEAVKTVGEAELINKSIEWYTKCLKENWIQERFYSSLQLGELYAKKGNTEMSQHYYMKTIEYDSERLEGIIAFAEMAYRKDTHLIVNLLYERFRESLLRREPLEGKLFYADTRAKLVFYNSVSSYYVKEWRSGLDACCQILTATPCVFSLAERKRTVSNLVFYLQALDEYDDDIKISQVFDNLQREDREISNYVKVWKAFFEKGGVRAKLTQASSFVPEFGGERGDIVVTMTSCKRLNLFYQTVNSILNTWSRKDWCQVQRWICVDDQSSDEDRQQMVDSFPFINFVWKSPEQRGHLESMRMIYKELVEESPGATYWVHLEDDFLFFDKREYLREAKYFLENDLAVQNRIHQLLFSVHYAETIENYQNLRGSLPLPGTQDIVLHDYQPGKTFPYLNNHYWPHYSFRPSMTRIAAIRQLGNFSVDSASASASTSFFEKQYATRWVDAGFQSAFLNRITHLHIGKLTDSKEGQNAYQLNGIPQFQNIS
jgi:glycosyltransferase involved in cell wall biosynthesis